MALEGEGITWTGQPSRQGIAIFSALRIVAKHRSRTRLALASALPYESRNCIGSFGASTAIKAPPLLTASGPLLQFVTNQNLGFVPLHGERDEEHQFGVTIPFRGWTIDADNFLTRVNNFFDHNNLNNSDIFFPVTIQGRGSTDGSSRCVRPASAIGPKFI